jgi:putative endonuclease
LDIVARDGRTLVFAEVKMREQRNFGDAAEAVTWQKRRRIARLALAYMARHYVAPCPCRFDVVSIHVEAGRPIVEVYQNAFDLPI